jgi:ArsR family transcriptional regulator
MPDAKSYCKRIEKIRLDVDDEEVKKISKKFLALSNPTRLKIVHLLKKHRKLCVCEIERAMKMQQSKVSYHLGILIKAGLLRREMHGLWSYYSLNGSDAEIRRFFEH